MRFYFLFLKEYFFWILFFLLCRGIFLIYNVSELAKISFAEIIVVFPNALYLDTSAACYLLVFSFVIFSVYAFFPLKIFCTIHRIYVALLLLVFSLIAVAELEIYDEWGTKLNVKAILFLQNPLEVIHTARTSFLIWGLMGTALLMVAGFFLHKKMVRLPGEKTGWKKAVLFILICPPLLFLGMRGGLQPIPIQQSDAYFSRHNVLNLAAVNSGWNLVHSILENKNSLGANPFQFYSHEDAQNTVRQMYRCEKDSTVFILKNSRPNIILIILEGWSGDVVKSLGGYDSITPHFEKLISQGILFENCYSSGSWSDQGMSCVFSAFPAPPMGHSLTSQPDKYVRLPCITTQFAEMEYATSFLFGGQLSYGNIRSYIYYNQFQKVIEGKDFSFRLPKGKLGVHDEFLFARQLQELKNEKEPFFAGMLTLSTHSPYDMPSAKTNLRWGGDENDYINSVLYADSVLNDFISKAKKERWYANTLFILISDHGHRSPRHYENKQPEFRKIPFVFFGEALREEFRGYRNKKICSQTDLAATLLAQLKMDFSEYRWSKNLFNPYSPEFAFYETTDGFGYICPGQYLVYSHSQNLFYYEQIHSPQEKQRLEKEGKSFLQVMFQEYISF